MSSSVGILLLLSVAFGRAAPQANGKGYYINLLSWSGGQEGDGSTGAPVMIQDSSLPKQMTGMIQTPRSGAMGAGCPPPFLQVMSQCFYVSRHHKLSWEGARLFCKQMGGDLAQPLHVYALMVHLQDTYPEIKEFHLGATDQELEGDWKYLSGRPVDSLAWMPGEPSDMTHEQNCLNFCFEGCTASYPPLNDMYCDWERHFVCEFAG